MFVTIFLLSCILVTIIFIKFLQKKQFEDRIVGDFVIHHPTTQSTHTKYHELEPEQLQRLRRSDSPMMRIISSDNDSAQILGDSGNVYTVTINSCTCMDFRTRQRPCKHIYRFLVYKKKLNPFDYLEDYRDTKVDYMDVDISKYYGNNMSLREYRVKTLSLVTKKRKTLTITAFDENDIVNRIPDEYSQENFTYELIDYFPPSERQVMYAISLDVDLPNKCCSIDASSLINQSLTNDIEKPPAALVDFAQKRYINFSYYDNYKALVRNILNDLSLQELIAFFIVYVVKDNKKTQQWDFADWDRYMLKAEELLQDTRFMNSFKRLDMNNLSEVKISKNTNAYRIIKEDINQF